MIIHVLCLLYVQSMISENNDNPCTLSTVFSRYFQGMINENMSNVDSFFQFQMQALKEEV